MGAVTGRWQQPLRRDRRQHKISPLKDLRVWLNPAHPGVWARFIGLIGEIVERCGVDGIQLDDHFAWPVDFAYGCAKLVDGACRWTSASWPVSSAAPMT